MVEASLASDYRLPRTTVPSRYDVVLSPDLHDRTFVGSVDISVTVETNCDRLTLNAQDLEILRAWAVGADGARNSASATIDKDLERLTLVFERTVEAGPSKLHIEFSGILNDDLAGFYASTYTTEDGVEKVIATTQMQSTDCRRAFPCWDEPDFKAVFAITLIVNDGLLAVSNMHELSRSTMASGKTAIRFADTPVMSTYLVAFVVGELEATAPVDVDGVAMRIIARPGQLGKAAFALEVGAFALRYFQDWYGIPYPGTKIDMIATPDFAAGAMENLGAITYRETMLLADPEKATRQDLENIVTVVSHEIAHMWFGDLVTMKWWNGIWLNEAFATFAETSCSAAFKPEWDKWGTFTSERAAAARIDGLHNTRPIEFPVLSPTDAEGMFDVLTYEKGASVLRQLEQYLGEIPFRDGVRHYLEKHRFANTETTDLFDSMEQVTGAPVRSLMDSWIFQGGYPIVSVALNATANTATFAQQVFTYLPPRPEDSAKRWSVPVLYRCFGPSGETSDHKLLLNSESETVDVPAGTVSVLLNAGGHGFYRSSYDPSISTDIRGRFASLRNVERFQIVADLWANVLRGAATADDFLTLTDSLGPERDLAVWRAAVEGWTSLDDVFDDERRNDLQARIRSALKPTFDELGWEPNAGEPALTGQLRGLVISTLGNLAKDPAVIDGARGHISAVLDETSTLPADVGASVLSVAAQNGDVALWERYNAARLDASSPQQSLRLLSALGTFPDDALHQQALMLLIGPSVKTQDAPYRLHIYLANRRNRNATWAFVRDRWAQLNELFPTSSIYRMVQPIPSLCQPSLAAEVKAFFAPGAGHDIPQSAKQLAQILELHDVMIGLYEREHAAKNA